jgi:hypothetical protein
VAKQVADFTTHLPANASIARLWYEVRARDQLRQPFPGAPPSSIVETGSPRCEPSTCRSIHRSGTGQKIEIRPSQRSCFFCRTQQVYLAGWTGAGIYGIQAPGIPGGSINPQMFSFYSQKKRNLRYDQTTGVCSAEEIIGGIEAHGIRLGIRRRSIVRFSGDLAVPEELFIEATLGAEIVRREKLQRSQSLRECWVFAEGFLAAPATHGNTIQTGGNSLRADVTTSATQLRLASTPLRDGRAGIGPKFQPRVSELDDAVFYSPPDTGSHVSAGMSRVNTLSFFKRSAT